jgi:MoxR-like ATPase
MTGEAPVADVREWAERVKRSVEQAFYGKQETVEKVLVALLCRGHCLIEDVPGVGKTVLARAVSRSIGGRFTQIQCTPDLLPADVLGVSVFNQKTSAFDFREGPIMTNVLLVDEISRATPRTQSALLEAMAEGQVSVEGRTLPLPDPFFLIATESPVEAEGTFPLPEVQKDRFFLSLSLGYPGRDDEKRVMTAQSGARRPLDEVAAVSEIAEVRAVQQQVLSVHVEASLRAYILSIVHATRSDARLFLGVSPRGSLALYRGAQAIAAIRGRDYVVPEDIREIALPVLRKRMIIKSEHAAKGLTEEAAVAGFLEAVGAPPLKDVV